jgi:hypothetical protein
MRPPLKLSSIDQEHLQELYNAGGVARDELPYSEVFEEIWSGFQNRTFKNAERDQLFAALLKYTRSSSNASTSIEAVAISDEQRKQLKSLLPRHAAGGKILPYSDEFEAARKEFNSHAGLSLSERDFWRVLSGGTGGRRKPPVRRPAKVAVAESDDEDEGE